MATIAERWMEKGWKKGWEKGEEKGRKKGMEKGMEKGMALVVQRLLEVMPAQQAAELLKLPLEQVEKLAVLDVQPRDLI